MMSSKLSCPSLLLLSEALPIPSGSLSKFSTFSTVIFTGVKTLFSRSVHSTSYYVFLIERSKLASCLKSATAGLFEKLGVKFCLATTMSPSCILSNKLVFSIISVAMRCFRLAMSVTHTPKVMKQKRAGIEYRMASVMFERVKPSFAVRGKMSIVQI